MNCIQLHLLLSWWWSTAYSCTYFHHGGGQLQIYFQHQGIEPIRVGKQRWKLEEDDVQRQRDSPQSSPVSQHNIDAVYERMFLQPGCAQLWQNWNR